jgi:uncharacterized protein
MIGSMLPFRVNPRPVPSAWRTSLMLLALMLLGAAPILSTDLAAQRRGAEAEIADWRMLAGLDYNTGQMTDGLKAVNGKRVRVPGYMVPLDDSARGVTEFILVPYYGACIHTPPPPPNQMVYVKMTGNRRVEVNLWEPIWIEGDLNVSEVDSPYGAIGHQLAGVTVSPYRW